MPGNYGHILKCSCFFKCTEKEAAESKQKIYIRLNPNLIFSALKIFFYLLASTTILNAS